ncbi:MAG: alpha/beta hydrolase [Parasphingorhabdus sp.]
MRTLLGGVAISIGIYLILLLLVFLFQRHLLYLPDQFVPDELHLNKMDVTSMVIQSGPDGDIRSLWRVPLRDNSPVILFLHGNAGSHYDRIPVIQAIAQEGAGVLVVGYPGYGSNPGSPSEQALYAAAQANFDWLISQSIAPGRIVIVGESLGSGVAAHLATQNEAAGLILIASYTGMDDMAQRQFPIFPAKWLATDRFRSIERIDQIDMPLSWIHGTADELIPFAMGQQLFNAAKDPKTGHAIEQGEHNDLWSRGIDDIIRGEAGRFVSGG